MCIFMFMYIRVYINVYIYICIFMQALDEKSWRSLILSCVQGNLLDQAVAFVEGLYGLEPTKRTASLSRPKAVASKACR